MIQNSQRMKFQDTVDIQAKGLPSLLELVGNDAVSSLAGGSAWEIWCNYIVVLS